ncbi:MAG: lipid-binding SYLF domain-containing protein [Candidatus Omnitrophota bacterium]|nr:lipid-binding SYLF domain-containing protein [Candidatus Omnitrophota bacterium]
MKKGLAILCVIFLVSFIFSYTHSYAEDKWNALVAESAKVLEEIQKIPEQSIPESLLKDCSAVAIFPSTVSAGLGIGGKYGQGIIMVKDEKAKQWSSPAVFTIAGGSIGLQIGGQATDFVLLIMNRRSVDGILQGKFKLGADAAVSAGPVGRNAEASTDVQLKGGILSYSRSRGLFAGIKLQGDVVAQHWEGNKALYGKDLSAKEIIIEHKANMPKSAGDLLKMLNKYR